jgi:hypothetical protein
MPGKAEKGEKAQCTWAVHEHFESISNAAWRRQRIFQQPANPNGTYLGAVLVGQDHTLPVIQTVGWGHAQPTLVEYEQTNKCLCARQLVK